MRSLLLPALALVLGTAPAVPAPRVVPNDNRVPAGMRRDSTVVLQLVARPGEWHPDGESAPGVVLPAFAEEGKAPRIPGPLLRVPAGTMVEVTVRNALEADTLRVHGLHARPLSSPADSVPIELLPGASRTVRFQLSDPGTFYYWGTTMRRVVAFRTGLDAQLTGAIVVDPRGEPRVRDRILVMGMWTDTVARSFLPRQRVLGVINGRSWPATEHLAANVGDTVRWRVINASGDLHPMHLHGFYFRVTSRGDGTTDTLFTPAQSPLAVTEAANMGATYAMTWIPERAGNWLFHCHIPEHFGARGPLGTARPAGTGAHAAHAGMNGLVMGITVRPARGAREATSAVTTSVRDMRLLIRPNVGSTEATPVFGYAWHAGGEEPPVATGLVAQPTAVFTRGEPARVTVVNRLPEPTSVHWHGIELESYFDGVPGFSGAGTRVTPLIAPGDSFVVRFTPPRAGTFIYHTHQDEERQMNAGLAGALVVVEPGARLDPATDHVVMLSSPADFGEANRTVLVNASADAPPLVMQAGTTHRLRIINMTMRRSGLRVALRAGQALQPWVLVAKDGAAIPAPQQVGGPRMHLVSIGETLDLEVTPREAGEMVVEVRVGPQAVAVVLGRLRIRVVAAGTG